MKAKSYSGHKILFLSLGISFALLINGSLHAQSKRANNWYFGIYAGLSFNDGSPPEVLYDGKTDYAGSASGVASISDENGNIRFYATGVQIWNREHQIMQNGYSMGMMSTQGAIFVPDPGNSNFYYYFNFGYDSPIISHFQYSIIDMRLDNGLGGVVTDKKNIHLLENASFHLSAVQHANTIDVWVVAHTLENNNYYSFKITGYGIEAPIVSTVGSIYNNSSGYLKISPNGKKIAAADHVFGGGCEILDFDTQTGIISDVNLVKTTTPVFAVEFSPDNSKLYAKGNGLNSFFQYDLNAGSPDEILASEILLSSDVIPEGALQLGPDGKIYCATSSYHIGVIHEPNKAGLECNYERYSIYVGDGRAVGEGLPSFIQSYLNDPEYATTQHCAGQPTQFNIANANGIDSVYWKFKDFSNMPYDTSTLLSPAYTFSGPGTYYPELTVYSG
ncbi:MAG TPA: hypothetical protein DCL86_14165, partial [Bacteroidales bacterium]|nr:hypothetical protein [Bacteroidales bacterium]